MRRIELSWLLAGLLILAWFSVQPLRLVFAELPVVRAVLFYSPTCGHCHRVITEVLPPLFEQYGDQLQIVGLNTASLEGQTLYQAAIEHYAIPNERRGVPTLIVDEIVLVGSLEIPERFPVLIEQYLAEGGIGWPDIPGLAEALQADEAAVDTTAEAPPDQATAPASVLDSPSRPNTDLSDPQNEVPSSNDLISRFRQDPAGNALSVLLLAGMLAVIGHVLRRVRRTWQAGTKILSLAIDLNSRRSWAIALLCVIGLVVSIYMAYVETTHTTAVCGPIGDCNTVQQSPYAMLFGLIPVGVLGVLGYAAVLMVWAVVTWGPMQFKTLSASALLGMALFGTVFSIYLTFLEPFVIGATCVWCLTSALSMTLILFILAESVSAHPN
jgi:uncharacterized membrane protein